MGKPSAPTPPSPQQTALAATGTNVATAIANAFLNNTNQVTPQGNLNYDQTGSFPFFDPYSGFSVNLPQFTATQTLSPTGQQVLDQTNLAQLNLAKLSNLQSGKLFSTLSTPFDYSGAPSAGDPSAFANMPGALYGFDPSEALNTNFGGFNNAGLSYGYAGSVAEDVLPYMSGSRGLATDLGNQGEQWGNLTGDPGAITRTYGPADDFSSDRQRVEQALFERVQPQTDRQLEQMRSQLADQGINYGSPAYQAAMDDFNRSQNDLRLNITAQGGQEQQRMMDMAAKRAGFEDAAQQQAYGQALGTSQLHNAAQQAQFAQALQRGQFANAAEAQDYAQALQSGQFYNAAKQQQNQEAAQRALFANQAVSQDFQQQQQMLQNANAARQNQFSQAALRGQFYDTGVSANRGYTAQSFDMANALRQQYLNELYTSRNLPINETTALMSGAQLAQPNFVNTPTNRIPTTDTAGLINNQFSQNLDLYKQQNQNYNSLAGGLLGLFGNLGGAYIRSDERSKKNIHRVGTVFAAADHGDEREKLPIYDYSYKDDPSETRFTGPMAQDVEDIDPAAVREVAGVKHIQPRRVMGDIMRAA